LQFSKIYSEKCGLFLILWIKVPYRANVQISTAYCDPQQTFVLQTLFSWFLNNMTLLYHILYINTFFILVQRQIYI